MKILFIHNSARTLISLRGDLITTALENNWKVYIAIPDSNDSDLLELKERGVSFIDIPLNRISLNPLQDIKLFLKIRKNIKAIQPDILFLTTVKPIIYGTFAKIFSNSNTKVISLLTGLGYLFQKSKNLRDLFIQRPALLLLRIAFYFNHFILFQNKDDYMEFLSRKLGSSRTKLKIVGSGINLDKFLPSKFPEGALTFLMASRLLYDKGVIEYLEAARRIKSVNPTTKFLLAGPFDLNPRSLKKKDIEVYIQRNIIEYLGDVKDIRTAIARCHIVVLPSYREGLPRILLEALAMNRMLITTDSPGCREIWRKNQKSIYLVKAEDIQDLQNTMIQLICKFEDNRDFLLLSQEPRKIAENYYSHTDINERILKVISQ